ncbi:MAG TPA: hypothetical protein VMH00_14305 [Candidatus Limnocylindrales bacterium]|nr:hypothetical protein [Candidatus Limnocylindrales bacterium]
MTKPLAFLALAFLLLGATAVPDKSLASPMPPAHRVSAAQDSETETVLSTFRPRAGMEDELLKTMNQNWSTLHKLGLVLDTPHLILRGKDDAGKPIFVEILTWRDHDAADHVPPEVETIWHHMNTLVEQRDGHHGIEFPEFEIVSPAP